MALYSPYLIKKLEKELEKDPRSKSFCALAYIYYKQGDVQKAKELCIQGLSHSPSYSKALILLAEIHYKENQLDEALKLLNQAQGLNPDNPNIYKKLAQIYKKQSQAEKALKAYKMLAFLSPNDVEAAASVQHLEKILRPPLILSENKAEALPAESQNKSPLKKLSFKQNQKLIKLNQILAHVENHIGQRAKV